MISKELDHLVGVLGLYTLSHGNKKQRQVPNEFAESSFPLKSGDVSPVKIA